MSGHVIDLCDGRQIPMTPAMKLKGRRQDQFEDATGMVFADIEDALDGLETADNPAKYILSRPFRHAFGAVIWSSMLAAGVTTADYWDALEEISVGDVIQTTLSLWAADAPAEEGVDPTQAGGEPAPEPESAPAPSTGSDSETT